MPTKSEQELSRLENSGLITSEEKSLKIMEEVQKLNPSSIVELYELDATEIGDDTVVYFHNGTSGNQYDSIGFNGKTYDALPIIIKGFEQSNNGEPPRPSMIISNVGGWVSALMLATKDLVGAKVIRRRTFARYLDGSTEAAAIEFPPDIFYINQKVRENRLLVEFELGAGYDLDGVSFPMRKVTSGICGWDFRGPGCAFAGKFAVTDKNGILFPGAKNFWIAWRQDIKYAVGSHVVYINTTTHETGVYEALLVAQGSTQNPSNTTYWKQVQRYRGVYSLAVTDYTYGDVVSVTRLGREQIYFCNWLSPVSPYVPAGQAPPSNLYWSASICVKTLPACRCHHDPLSAGHTLPFGAFPGTLNLPEV